MPLYFGTVAPQCPLSSDQPSPLDKVHLYPRTVFVQPIIPTPRDLESAITSANVARSIISNLFDAKVINNVKTVPDKAPKNTPDKFKNKTARWSEQKDKRVKGYFKYYAKTSDGNDDKNKWVIMERLERMVWYDRAWKSYLVWEYGDKGEGKRVKSALDVKG